jgi:hypothetical protein
VIGKIGGKNISHCCERLAECKVVASGDLEKMSRMA